jgi:signal transduction histidine kinase
MKTPLKILIVEDSPADAELVLAELRRAGFAPEWKRVEDEAGFLAELKNAPAIILSDYSMPRFSGLRALELLRASELNIPFILISGTVGEEIAVEAIKQGASDYFLKDRLARLGPAVRRALQEVAGQVERRKLEEQFIQAQKMEVLGQLAGGVAHDFNNILAVIMGYCDLIANELGADSPLQSYAGEIRHASERAVGLTRQLLIFSRRQTVQPVVLNPDEVVSDLDKMLRRLLDENVILKCAPGNQTGRIKADPGYIGQVLMNLVVNARDAMPNGGTLTIATRNVTLAAGDLGAHPGARPGEYVMISVTDTGTGMTDEVKAHIFEAFFTTKPAGKGTGLGLSTCQTIVQQSGGHIAIISAPGQGSTFQVYFPRVDEPVDEETRFISAGPLPRGTETLLLVEDEPTVRHMAERILAGQGYEVLTAANGQDGLHVAREHRGPPLRLVITDVVMPVMNGKVMAEWLQATYPDLKVLFTSGYTDDLIAKQGVLESGVEFLSKPYTSAQLARKVRHLLDHGQVSPGLRKSGVKTNPATPAIP